MSDTDVTIEQLQSEIESLKRGDNNGFVGLLRGLGLAILILTVGELVVWYVNWFSVWLMYWLVVHILPFRIIYDLRLIVWAGVFAIVGFFNVPHMSISKLWEYPQTTKSLYRRWTFVVILIPGLILWLVYFITSLISFPW